MRGLSWMPLYFERACCGGLFHFCCRGSDCRLAHAADLHGFTAPRKFSVCQHVTARSKPLLLDGSADIMKEGFATPEDWRIAAKHDPEMAKLIQLLDNPRGLGNVFDSCLAQQTGGASEWMLSIFTSPIAGKANSIFFSSERLILRSMYWIMCVNKCLNQP